MKNPWLRPAPDYYPAKEVQSVSAEDRILELKSFDSCRLIAAIRWPGTQVAVKARAKRILKKRGIDVN